MTKLRSAGCIATIAALCAGCSLLDAAGGSDDDDDADGAPVADATIADGATPDARPSACLTTGPCFRPPEPLVVPAVGDATDIAIADFDGDGNGDIVVVGTSGLVVLFGNGDGTFGTTPFEFTENGVTSVSVGNFDDEEGPDIVFAHAGAIGLLRHEGGQSFTTRPSPRYEPTDDPFWILVTTVEAADFGTDGIDDLIVRRSNGQLFTIANLGIWMWGEPPTPAETGAPERFTVGRFLGGTTEDMDMDLLFRTASDAVYVGRGDQLGGFQELSGFYVGTTLSTRMVGMHDQADEVHDRVAIALDCTSNCTSTELVNLHAASGSVVGSYIPTGITSFATTDIAAINLDRPSEGLVLSNSAESGGAEDLLVLSNLAGETFQETVQIDVGGGAIGLATGSLNGDAVDDIVVLRTGAGNLSIILSSSE